MPNILETLQDDTQFDRIKQGIDNLADTAQDLAEEIPRVAESAMRLGYAYAKAEDGVETGVQQSADTDDNQIVDAEFQPLLSSASNVLEPQHLKGETCWTKDALKARFGNCLKAYQYLQDVYGLKFSRSWEKVIAAFNNKMNHATLEEKVIRLEQTIISQQNRIIKLEEKLDQVLQLLQPDL